MALSDAADKRNQVDALVRGFKKSGLVQPLEGWAPVKTGGDVVRDVIGEVRDERESAIETGNTKGRDFWNARGGE